MSPSSGAQAEKYGAGGDVTESAERKEKRYQVHLFGGVVRAARRGRWAGRTLQNRLTRASTRARKLSAVTAVTGIGA